MLDSLTSVPIDPIFQLLYDYQVDPRPEKISLGIGLYTQPDGNPFVFPVVQHAAAELDRENFNYQPIQGNGDFLKKVSELFLQGADQDRIARQASCGGTQACKLFAGLMQRDEVSRTLYVGTPTWGNHFAVFAGLDIERFDHLDDSGMFSFESYKKVVQEMEPGSLLLLHGGGTHNPSGMNATAEHLDELIPLLQEKQIVVFIDWAYAGFGLGFAPDRDWVMKLWDALDDVAVGVSFSKNASLYEHRCGALFVKTDQVQVIESNLQQLSRESISMAPGFGQEVMLNVLNNGQEAWLHELESARQDVESRKAALLDLLPESFQFLRKTQGMFGLLPLDAGQIQALQKEHALYIPAHGRINWAGLQVDKITSVAERIREVA